MKNELASTNALALFQDPDKFAAAFELAEKSTTMSADLAGGELLKFTPDQERRLYFTGEHKTIEFANAPEPKICPLFATKEREILPCAEAVIVSAFSPSKSLAPGFYLIECIGEERNTKGTYKTFTIQQVSI